jgi:uncharacterized DUF497 family protein
MGKTIISDDGKYEWDEDKNVLNIKNHGFALAEITDIFDDPFFLEDYDEKHSTEDEVRYYGIGNSNNLMITVFFTKRGLRTRLITARLTEPIEETTYHDNIKKTFG